MEKFGRYFLFLASLFTNRERFGIYVKLIFQEAYSLGVNSVVIVVIVSTFIGAVSTIQTAYNLISPLVPTFIIGTVVRDMTILELCSTITCVVLAGKVGSAIAGGLGTMRITEQIDALEVMGINSASYLVLPKVIACLITFPMLVILSASLSLLGGYLAGMASGVISPYEYVYGIRSDFMPFTIFFTLIKSIAFAFLISTISAFEGYYTRGGALEVGQSSTRAVTNSCIAVLCADYGIAQLLL